MRPLCRPTSLQRARGCAQSTSSGKSCPGEWQPPCSAGELLCQRSARGWRAHAPLLLRGAAEPVEGSSTSSVLPPWGLTTAQSSFIRTHLRVPTDNDKRNEEGKKKKKGGGIRLTSYHNCNYYPREMARHHFEAKSPLGQYTCYLAFRLPSWGKALQRENLPSQKCLHSVRALTAGGSTPGSDFYSE